jgi:hypothetical protein
MSGYDIDFHESGYIKEHIGKFLLFPEHWKDPKMQIPITLVWSHIPFNISELNNVPNNKKGIYCFVIKPEYKELFETSYLSYVGMTRRNFRTRYKEYLDDSEGKGKPRHRIYKMLKLWATYLHFYYAPINNNKIIEDCEDKLLNVFVPKVNTKIPIAKIKPELKDIYL